MRNRLPLIAALLANVTIAQPEALKPKRVATYTAQRIAAAGSQAQPGEIHADVLKGLASMQSIAAWIPNGGVPVVVSLPLGQPVRTVVDGDVLYESSSAVKMPAHGLAGDGEVTIRLWSWYRPGWQHTEHWVEVANDSPWSPPGGIESNGVWRFLFDVPGGYALPRAPLPYMLTPWWHPDRPSFMQVDFPRADLPDGCYRGAGVVVGWGTSALDTAFAKLAVPDHGARSGALGTLWDVDTTRGVVAAAKDAQSRTVWLAMRETDAYADWGARRNHGAGGDDRFLFGQLNVPGLQEGGSNLSADLFLLQALAVEGRRPTWLDWAELEAAGKGYFVPGRRGETFYEFYKIHTWSRPGFARGSWTDATFGDFHGWNGPNHEHRYNATLFQLAGLTLHPVVRDKALQYGARAAAACGLNSIADGAYYGGGAITDYMREWCRQLSDVAQMRFIAERWGLTDLVAQCDAFLSTKWEMAVTRPDGWRHKVGNDGKPIPWCNTPMSHNVPNGSLKLEDIVGTVFDEPYYRNDLRKVNVTAWWQRNQLGPQVIWALKTRNVHALHGLRDLAQQMFASVLGPDSDPQDLSDLRALRIAKYGSTRVLGLGRGWQTTGAVSPIAEMKVIEGWTYETACWAAIFDDRGVDGTRREQYRRALLSIRPDHEWGQWGSAPPSRWVEFAASCGGVPTLPPPPMATSVFEPR